MKAIARLVLTMASVLLWWACDEVPRGRDGSSDWEWSRPQSLQTAAAGGQWSTTGNMATARYNHTATLLPSGQVLVSGGTGSVSAEVYDPLTGKWSITDNMVTARYNHTATLLPSGKVLVSGGSNALSSGPLASAEVYDPLTGKWSPTGGMVTARSKHTATLLPSGQVLVSGGSNSSDALASAELYDPLTGTWSPMEAMATARSSHTAALLPSGQVLVTGGRDSSGPLASTELYDPLTGKWSPMRAMAMARSAHTATLLPSGQVLVSGGSSPSGPLASAEVYDPGTGTWRLAGSMATARFSHTATLLPSGKVLVSAGNNLGNLLASAEVYDPGTGTWSSAGSMATAREWPTATLLPSGQVLVSGGLGLFSAIAQAEVYDPGTGTWSPTGTMDTALVAHAATLLPSGQVLVSGGRSYSSGSPFARALLYDPGTRTWNPTGDMVTARFGHTATLLPSGQVLVTGGRDSSGPLASAELFDPLTGKWSPMRAMAMARSAHTATLLPSGQVLVSGGSSPSGPLTSAEVYDPLTGKWSITGNMVTARYNHTATLLPSGKVLVTSGHGELAPLASAELYDPLTGTWNRTGGMATARDSHTATLLPSGKVLVTGGVGVSSTTGRMEMRSSAEVYDPGSGAWSSAGTLATARCRHEATLLPSGKVLVTGGYTTPGLFSSTASAEVYDPLTGTWSLTGDMGISRPEHTATLLPSGQVLVTGDWRSGYIFASVDVYEDPVVRPEGHPLIDPSAEPHPGKVFLIKGSRLRGLSEASSGDSRNSATNLPLIRLFSVEGGTLSRAVPMDRRSDTEVSVRMPMVPSGYYILSVMTNAIHGGRLVHMDGSLSAPELDSPGAFVNTRKPAIGGTATPGTTVRVWLDGAPVGTTPVDARGRWSFIPDTALEEGRHQAQARATDEAGNVSPDSAKRDFEVDTLPPGVPVMNELVAFINNPTPVFAGTAEPGSTVTVWLNHDGTETVAGTVVADAEGDWSLPSTELREGLHGARATATDKAGNVSPGSGSRFFTVDTQAPAAPVVTSPDKPFINTTKPFIGGAAEAGSTVTVGLGEDVVETTVADAAGTWKLIPGTALREGLNRVWAIATDQAGNVSLVSAEYSFTVDTQPPEAPVVTAPGNRTDTQTPIIAGIVEPGMTVMVWLDDDAANAEPVPVNEAGNWRLTPSTALEFGYHSVFAIAVDAAGNASTPSQHRFVIQRSHYGWSCTTTPTSPATWALLALIWSLGRRRPRSPARNLDPR